MLKLKMFQNVLCFYVFVFKNLFCGPEQARSQKL